MTERELLLICLAEECAEVAQRVSKALRFTLAEVQPGQALNNAERISQELCDLCAVVDLLEQSGAIPIVREESAIAAKKAKLTKYLAYSKQVGTVTAPMEVGK